jgi:hypothetical protein
MQREAKITCTLGIVPKDLETEYLQNDSQWVYWQSRPSVASAASADDDACPARTLAGMMGGSPYAPCISYLKTHTARLVIFDPVLSLQL